MQEEQFPEELTLWLRRMNAGEPEAAEAVAYAVYQQLKRLAQSAMSGDHHDNSLQPTLLVNEAFLRLLKGQPILWHDRHHFFSVAARMMRRIVIDHFRERDAQKRPPRHKQVALEETVIFDEDRRDEALMVDEALHQLAEVDARAAHVVELRYFGGLTVEQIGEVLQVTARTVRRDWEMAQWWLKRYFANPGSSANRGISESFRHGP